MSLIPQRFLFQLAVPCRSRRPLWKPPGLDESFRLPDLGGLEGAAPWADLRAAWSEEGLAFSLLVAGKKTPPWCRATRLEDSDGLQVWIDTRNVHNVHRAGRFCHRFLFLPTGGGPRQNEPLAQFLPINRARQLPRPVASGELSVQTTPRAGGYRLDALLPAATLTGFDPQEHPRLGFTYAVIDRELGVQTFGVGRPLPFDEDPSLWGTLELEQ